MSMIYTFKPGSHIKADAQAVGERLDVIRARGELTAAAVVADARSATSVLHPLFEWDDRKAAHKYRLDQAGHIIRCVTVVVEEPEPAQGSVVGAEPAAKATVVRAFLPVERQDGRRVFEATTTVLSDAEYRRQVLEQAHSELGAVARKYRELRELAEVVGAIERVGKLLSAERLSAEG